MAKKGSRKLLEEYFLEHVGQVLDSKELKTASGDVSEWARRIRELRDELGMQIESHNDRADLRPGQYILISSTRLPQNKRSISKEVRAIVLDRDGGICQLCGAVAGEPHPIDGKPSRMQIAHVIDKSSGGTDEIDNLKCLCSHCNEGAKNVTTIRPTYKQLLVQVRRSPNHDQLELLRWLIKKYKTHLELELQQSHDL